MWTQSALKNVFCMLCYCANLGDLRQSLCQEFLVDSAEIGHFLLTVSMHVHTTVCSGGGKMKCQVGKREYNGWDKCQRHSRLQETHLHISGPVWTDPTADCHSGHRKWGSCSCSTWSDVACQSWSALSGTTSTQKLYVGLYGIVFRFVVSFT